jgi:L-lactate dehydrogenase complex protein LldG
MEAAKERQMNPRDVVLGSIRRSLGATGREEPRRAAVDQRLALHPRGPVPARGELAPAEQLKLFRRMLEEANGTVEELASADALPAAVAAYLRSKNLPLAVRRGADPRLESISWENEPALEVSLGASDGAQLAAISHAFAAVAETGTLALVSGADNPTTLNFLPEQHFVVLDAETVVGDYETVWDMLREYSEPGEMPRAVNWITGPSRSADIEQVLLHGAHGPKNLHVFVIGTQRAARARRRE